MTIALPTCSTLPDWEVDDAALHEALRRCKLDFAQPVWDDPAVDWSAYDAVLIRTTWDYQEKRERFVAWAERTGTLTALHNPAPVVRWNTHKSYLYDLHRSGVPIAPSIFFAVGDRVDLGVLLDQRGWSRGFVKPLIGATARETLRFHRDEVEIAQAHVDRLLADEPLVVQPYLSRVETEGELSALMIDGVLTHAVRKVPVSGDYRVQDDFGAHDEPTRLTPAARSVVDMALSVIHGRFGPLLYSRIDLLRTDEGAWVLNEAELVEPSLFFRHGPAAAERLVDGLVRRVPSAGA